jgi:hypothetical protein
VSRTANTGCGRRRQRGVALSELAIAMPLLLVMVLATVDFGRYIYSNQVANDLAREAGMLVSRGATYAQAFQATFDADAPLDVQRHGNIVISRIRRHDDTDASPWIVEQETAGVPSGYASRIGSVDGPAELSQIDALTGGVTLMAVEINHRFEPLFLPSTVFGVNIYPGDVYNVAIF